MCVCVCFFLIYIYLFSLFLFSSSNVSNFYFSVQWWKIYTSEGSHCPQWTQYTSYSQPKRSNIVFFVTVNSDFLSSNTNSVKLSLSLSLSVFFVGEESYFFWSSFFSELFYIIADCGSVINLNFWKFPLVLLFDLYLIENWSSWDHL